jgi:hypothetical protein
VLASEKGITAPSSKRITDFAGLPSQKLGDNLYIYSSEDKAKNPEVLLDICKKQGASVEPLALKLVFNVAVSNPALIEFNVAPVEKERRFVISKELMDAVGSDLIVTGYFILICALVVPCCEPNPSVTSPPEPSFFNFA